MRTLQSQLVSSTGSSSADVRQNMKPAYENVARAFASEPSVVVAQMNADDEQNKPIAGAYDVHSFPTIKLFPKGGKEPVMYSSGRTEEQFIDVGVYTARPLPASCSVCCGDGGG